VQQVAYELPKQRRFSGAREPAPHREPARKDPQRVAFRIERRGVEVRRAADHRVAQLAHVERVQVYELSLRLDPALEEAARLAGAGPLRRLVTIALPLLAPAAAAAGILVALSALNEITVSILLYAAGSQTLGVVVFGLHDGGAVGQAAAVSVVGLVLVLLLMGAASLLARRLPPGTLPWSA